MAGWVNEAGSWALISAGTLCVSVVECEICGWLMTGCVVVRDGLVVCSSSVSRSISSSFLVGADGSVNRGLEDVSSSRSMSISSVFTILLGSLMTAVFFKGSSPSSRMDSMFSPYFTIAANLQCMCAANQ